MVTPSKSRQESHESAKSTSKPPTKDGRADKGRKHPRDSSTSQHAEKPKRTKRSDANQHVQPVARGEHPTPRTFVDYLALLEYPSDTTIWEVLEKQDEVKQRAARLVMQHKTELLRSSADPEHDACASYHTRQRDHLLSATKLILQSHDVDQEETKAKIKAQEILKRKTDFQRERERFLTLKERYQAETLSEFRLGTPHHQPTCPDASCRMHNQDLARAKLYSPSEYPLRGGDTAPLERGVLIGTVAESKKDKSKRRVYAKLDHQGAILRRPSRYTASGEVWTAPSDKTWRGSKVRSDRVAGNDRYPRAVGDEEELERFFTDLKLREQLPPNIDNFERFCAKLTKTERRRLGLPERISEGSATKPTHAPSVTQDDSGLVQPPTSMVRTSSEEVGKDGKVYILHQFTSYIWLPEGSDMLHGPKEKAEDSSGDEEEDEEDSENEFVTMLEKMEPSVGDGTKDEPDGMGE